MSNSDLIVTDMSYQSDNVLRSLDTETSVSDLALLLESELQQRIVQSSTLGEAAQEKCLPQLVAEQASRASKSIALVSDTQVMSYGELNQRANQLARHLRGLGVGPGILVGCCLARSVDMVVGLLGILKAGGVYVPLDPAYPAERLAFMLHDSCMSVLITREAMFPQSLINTTVQCINLDSDAALLNQYDGTDVTLTASAADLAYVIYTSGSTGQPKGVEITHGNLLNLISWHQQAFAITSHDRATQISSPAFDATGWEIWPYLAAGASIYFPDEETRIVPGKLRDWLVSNSITVTFLPTPLAVNVMMLAWPPTATLRYLLTGADTLHQYPLPGLPFTLVNNYGPTETTVVATSGAIEPHSAAHADQRPTIGRPIANTEIYILDAALQPVPVGVVGELYIGGAGLARGYHNRPDLTVEKFIPHPFQTGFSARLYKTGDLARYVADGQIEFIGRSDHQVKIRGFRIELGEIESVLNQHPSIQQAVVTVREDVAAEKRLIAYVVPQQQSTANLFSLLHDSLSARLPAYMIPATFVQLQALPLTPHGKVDRTALPAPDSTNIMRDEALVIPDTQIEVRLARIVSSLLSLEQMGIDDNFFMLGGHSLLATQIIARVTEEFAVNLSLRTLFTAPTIRKLSAEIERCNSEAER
ncbi:MAG TPA: non-ribosomal peptide synthetase [Dictyobacter sp.]|jgi:amino acid adenylation domain-containing protein|nr:non-ribosomal peptide synthetase [Dictyobacter sp.]